MSESLSHRHRSESDRRIEAQRKFDQLKMLRIGKYAVEAPTQDQVDAFHQEAIADDYERTMMKKGYEFVTNEPPTGHRSLDGRRVNALKNIENKYGWGNAHDGAAFDRDGNFIPEMRSVYVHTNTKHRKDREPRERRRAA